MFTQRPAESGDHMYLDFTKLSSLKSNLLRDKAVLEREKERLELQIAKLATNTQTETVVSDLKESPLSWTDSWKRQNDWFRSWSGSRRSILRERTE